MDEAQKKFGELYDAYADKIYRFAYLRVSSREVAQDLTADAFTRFWEQYRQNHEGIKNPRAFLYAIAKNLVIDHYRARGKASIVSADLPGLEIVDRKNNFAQTAETNSDMEQIRKALSGLKEDYQNVIIWRYLDDLEMADVAQLLGRTEPAARVLLHRAMKELKNRLV